MLIYQEPLDIISLEGGDEECGIQLSFLQGFGSGGDILLYQHRRRFLLGRLRFQQAVSYDQLPGNGIGTAACWTDTDSFARELTEAIKLLISPVEHPQGLAVHAPEGVKML